MRKEKLDEKTVCDVIGCGGLSTYRLTFDNGTNIFLCDKCYLEAKNFFINESGENEKSNKKR